MVRVERFELPTYWPQTSRATCLRYTRIIVSSKIRQLSSFCHHRQLSRELDGLRKPSGLYDHPRSGVSVKKQLSLFPTLLNCQTASTVFSYHIRLNVGCQDFLLVLPHGIDPWSHDYPSCALPLSYRRELVGSLGFEPRTCGLKDRCSNLLS